MLSILIYSNPGQEIWYISFYLDVDSSSGFVRCMEDDNSKFRFFIPNPCMLERDSSTSKRPVILYAGAFEKRKGIDILVRAFLAINKEFRVGSFGLQAVQLKN